MGPPVPGVKPCTSDVGDRDSPLWIFLSPIHFHVKPLERWGVGGPTCPAHLLLNALTSPSGPGAWWEEVTVITDISEAGSQGSQQPPLVCHSALPAAC